MTNEQVTAIILAVLGGGGATVFWVLFKGRELWRVGRIDSEARTIRNCVKWAERESQRAERYADLLDYWRSRAGELEYIILTAPGLGRAALPTRAPLPPDPEREYQREMRELVDDKEPPATKRR